MKVMGKALKSRFQSWARRFGWLLEQLPPKLHLIIWGYGRDAVLPMQYFSVFDQL
jgi:hypothetical protein